MERRSLAAVSSAAALMLVLASCGGGDGEGESDDPIVVGSTLSLTGAFAATGAIHKIAGEQFVARLNANGGLLGRQVEWRVLDDESDQAKVSPLYERLISQDQVDLIIGPYATPNILSAMAVAERHGYVMPQHTAVLAPLLTYECQFPAWSIGPKPNVFVPNQLFDAVATLPDAAEAVAIADQPERLDRLRLATAPDDDKTRRACRIAKERGLEVVAEVQYPPTTTDWAPIATQVRDARARTWSSTTVSASTRSTCCQAMEQLNYKPPMMFSLFPAPGPLLGLGADAERPAVGDDLRAERADLAKLRRRGRGDRRRVQGRGPRRPNLPYTVFETQAAASWNAWEILVAGVKARGQPRPARRSATPCTRTARTRRSAAS